MTCHVVADTDVNITERPLAQGTQPSALTDIYRSDRNLAVWQRSLPNELIKNIQQMLQEGKPLAVVKTVTPDTVADLLRDKLDGYACADDLSDDIALIVDMFCCLFDLQEVGLRLTTLDTAMCPKFHVDHLPCRLVTTYAGFATQWLNNDDIDRSKLGAGSAGLPDHQSGLLKTNVCINQLKKGDVALLKGSGWEGNEATGVVHRSPETTGTERRLLLTLDMR
ncbi:succinylglutamate desuccinylase [Vibrio sp. 10N.286.49.C2]|uniref:DUF1826 domain-containing protein n=1 Tax=unclassified Vibrio TaxID=2614977 RepID=UPI000C8200C5|nr:MULTISPECIES: DUF1826 domain-containing protein [unclassified Vibrio]PMH39360.1 succinylglutamate desuccinylase [Vibrio sp. 10N.286.49.C2]PMH54290.1 succinylglutamate desuccinylase [Vibrio sp. 10N.286.49.B1]PMH80983.1 succinylglutamate desuccinylase [Vibrio sp. 10N.286.48.B7]